VEKYLQPKYDPLQVFAGSKTPAGLYARQKWRYEGETETWAKDFSETVRSLRADQLANDSWNDSEIVTIQRLFGLHLTVREPDKTIQRSLDWLLSSEDQSGAALGARHVPGEGRKDMKHEIDKTLFHSLPFVYGFCGHFRIFAGLFLSNCFGFGEEERVRKLYDLIAHEIETENGHRCSLGCTSNALRAFVTHNRYSKSKATAMIVDYLSRRQLSSGRWKGETPFYMTFNALAHLDSMNARRQCMAASESIMAAQNKDGSWGRTQKEWNTFLVVHALNRLNK
jgi:hypothetical protein